MAEYLVQEESLVAVANAIRTVAGLTGGLKFPAGWKEAIATLGKGGGAGSLLVDEVVEVPQPMDIHFPAYENLKVLGDIGSRYVVLFLPVNVPTINQNTTQGVIAAKTYLDYDFCHMVTKNGGTSQIDRGMDLAIIVKGAVQVGPIAASLPIAPGTYRLVVFE